MEFILYDHRLLELNNHYLAGVFYNSSLITITILFLIEILIFINSDYLLLLVGQPKDSAKYGTIFIIVYLPGLYFT